MSAAPIVENPTETEGQINQSEFHHHCIENLDAQKTTKYNAPPLINCS